MSADSAVYSLGSPEGFEWILPVREADFERLRFDGQPVAHSWKPVRMRLVRHTERGRALRPSDFPSCSGGDMLILSRSAKDRLTSRLQDHAELLPLECDDGEFWAVNVTRLVDCLDESASQLVRDATTGAILIIQKHVFRQAALVQEGLFKLCQIRRGLIYVTEPFVEIVNHSGLSGLEFVRLWPPRSS